MLMANSNFREKMIAFDIDNELKEDLVYCQKSLRHFIKVHQMLVAKLAAGVPAHETLKIKRYLREIESEITEIGNDQKPLILQLNEDLKKYLTKLAAEFVEIDREVAYGFVSRALSTHYELSYSSKYSPKTVTERLDENQLLNKYELTSFEEYMRKEKENLESICPEKQKQQVSLLKPKDERIVNKPLIKPVSVRPNHNLLNRITYSNAKAQIPYIAPSIAGPSSAVTTVINGRESREFIKIQPNEQLPLGPLFNVLKPLPLKKDANINKSKVYVPAAPATVQTVAIKNSRMNLLQALNKAKNQKPGEVKEPQFTHKTISSVIANRKRGSLSRSPTPVSLKSTDSEESEGSGKRNRSSDDAEMPEIEDEVVVPQPVDLNDIGQEGYLKLFGLITLDEQKQVIIRKSERKRRSVTSTERKDFHYGSLDLYEQQFQMSAKRRNNTRPILYSPPFNKDKKKQYLLSPRAGASGIARSSLSLPSTAAAAILKQNSEPLKIVMPELENKTCIACNKIGSTDTLSACIFCCNFFHIRCHSNISNPNLLRQRENICPICLLKKQRENVSKQQPKKNAN